MSHATDHSFNPYLPYNPYLPFDPTIGVLECGTFGPFPQPLEFTGWKDESLSWKNTAYLHAGLNPTDTYQISGPDALKLLSDVSINGLSNFEIGAARHLIMCNSHGNIVAHGMALRTAEQEFITYWLAPYLPYVVASGKYEVRGEDLNGTAFLFQIAGPRSLEILEAATESDLHDIRFARFRHATFTIDGQAIDVQLLRIGMSGTLAYEVHGPLKHAHAIYSAIYEAGKPFGIRRLGATSYPLNHPENGFVQAYDHFLYAWDEDPELQAWMRQGEELGSAPVLRGSMGPDETERYANPVDIGWGHMIKLDHDFVGREALEPLLANPTKKMVTLVWNKADLLEVYGSLFEEGEEYEYMTIPNSPMYQDPSVAIFNDRVLVDGKTVGMSMGRMYSYSYRKMISICPIDVEYSAHGTEVSVLWGEPGSRQKEIRATVERFPLLDLERNEKIDVSSIPRHKRLARS